MRVQNNFGSNKITGPKILGLIKMLSLSKFLDLTKVWVHKNYDPNKIGYKKFGQIGLVTAEIFLI